MLNKHYEALEAALTALTYDPNAYGYKEIANIAIKAIEAALRQPAQQPNNGFWYYEN
jgi:hypothetical protein